MAGLDMKHWYQLRTYGVVLLLVLCTFLVEWRIIDQLMVRAEENCQAEELERFRADAAAYVRHYPVSVRQKAIYQEYVDRYEQICRDIQMFPVESSYIGEISYVDSWYGERTFGGDRRHEGTDLMSASNLPGEIPVVSMTDGVIRNMGWLTLGGWRIGIQSDSGIYYYYAHLDSYAEGLEPGTEVCAGQLLGFMGNSGYGEEGTTGMFDVHLHVGIYMYDEMGTEISVNPYPFLIDAEMDE